MNIDFKDKLKEVLLQTETLLIDKNKKYGNAALNPIQVFSKSSNTEGIKIRIDDKISRLKTQHIEEDEDVLDDLIGYFILLKIAINYKN
jgi:hypothetical protein